MCSGVVSSACMFVFACVGVCVVFSALLVWSVCVCVWHARRALCWSFSPWAGRRSALAPRSGTPLGHRSALLRHVETAGVFPRSGVTMSRLTRVPSPNRQSRERILSETQSFIAMHFHNSRYNSEVQATRVLFGRRLYHPWGRGGPPPPAPAPPSFVVPHPLAPSESSGLR
jgi:hypothetical protein